MTGIFLGILKPTSNFGDTDGAFVAALPDVISIPARKKYLYSLLVIDLNGLFVKAPMIPEKFLVPIPEKTEISNSIF